MICGENVNIAAHLPVLTILRSFEGENRRKHCPPRFVEVEAAIVGSMKRARGPSGESPDFMGLSPPAAHFARPEPGPVGVNVDPLGEGLAPIVLPDGFMLLLVAAAGEPAALPVVVPLVDGLAADPPLAEPLPLCASAKLLDSANAHAKATVVIFMVVSFPDYHDLKREGVACSACPRRCDAS
jgi:hypothetical protein